MKWNCLFLNNKREKERIILIGIFNIWTLDINVLKHFSLPPLYNPLPSLLPLFKRKWVPFLGGRSGFITQISTTELRECWTLKPTSSKWALQKRGVRCELWGVLRFLRTEWWSDTFQFQLFKVVIAGACVLLLFLSCFSKSLSPPSLLFPICQLFIRMFSLLEAVLTTCFCLQILLIPRHVLSSVLRSGCTVLEQLDGFFKLIHMLWDEVYWLVLEILETNAFGEGGILFSPVKWTFTENAWTSFFFFHLSK